jgi:3-deoxy-manno-octulosonate cytidylyltransferase (CMP-KDO synthetase)
LAASEAAVATLCERVQSLEELFDPNVVKVVTDVNGNAIYFSRAPIPWDRDAFAVSKATLPADTEHYRHIGLYAYRAGFILEYVTWPQCALEQAERLEQLRMLWRGVPIRVAKAGERPGRGVDTEEDLAYATRRLTGRG